MPQKNVLSTYSVYLESADPIFEDILVFHEDCPRHVRQTLIWLEVESNNTVMHCSRGNLGQLTTQVQHVISEAGGSRFDWFLMEKQVSPKCAVAILGLGNSRFQRIKDGRGDLRFKIWGRVTLYPTWVSFCLCN